MKTSWHRTIIGSASLLIAAAVWLPMVHLFYARTEKSIRNGSLRGEVEQLANRHIGLWYELASRQQELERMRRSNAEWDFMGRSFLAWSFCELNGSCYSRPLQITDDIIQETLALERKEGHYFFLMPYAQARPFVAQPARSQFVDGEIALMLACRRLVEEKPEYKPLLQERVRIMVERMEKSPTLCAESYPDECWTFCTTIALAAIKISDVLDGTDHSAFLGKWVDTARNKLIHRETGLLVSSFTLDGTHMDGPEGSSIWMSAHCLRLIDDTFAAEQYERARKELGRDLIGFGYAREWPRSWKGSEDIDAGAVVPILGASPGASGLALVGASSFHDWDYFSKLLASLDFAAFPVRKKGTLKYCASNQVGDAVMLYAMVLGPLWDKAKRNPIQQ